MVRWLLTIGWVLVGVGLLVYWHRWILWRLRTVAKSTRLPDPDAMPSRIGIAYALIGLGVILLYIAAVAA